MVKYNAEKPVLTRCLTLQDDYVESKMYPIIPRYFMLKEMIHDVMRDPAFVEICQEITQSPPVTTAS